MNCLLVSVLCAHNFFLLFSVNGDLSNNKKSTLLVEDFIKVDVLLVKVCHKRRKVRLTVPNRQTLGTTLKGSFGTAFTKSCISLIQQSRESRDCSNL